MTLQHKNVDELSSIREATSRSAASGKKIWIDLDNSPHVPFFVPIMDELRRRGYEVCLTARDCFQVCGLADLFQLSYVRIGRHYGRHKIMKALGTTYRSLQLLPTIWRERPNLAVSHGSRGQLLAATLSRIPTIVIVDYEFAKPVPGFAPKWVIIPHMIPASSVRFGGGTVLKYPGIKEDVYVSTFKPDSSIKRMLGIRADSLLVTIRPPATEAHYHNPESEILFDAVMEKIGRTEDVQAVLLPRNEKQGEAIRKSYAALFGQGKVMIPGHAIDGLNLIWHSDVVISGGGTMNREAAAMDVPVYSIFRGTIGAVDRYLADNGRLTLLENVEEIRTKLKLQKRMLPVQSGLGTRGALKSIVDHIVTVIDRPKVL